MKLGLFLINSSSIYSTSIHSREQSLCFLYFDTLNMGYVLESRKTIQSKNIRKNIWSTRSDKYLLYKFCLQLIFLMGDFYFLK
jgi:hypothetical protein